MLAGVPPFELKHGLHRNLLVVVVGASIPQELLVDLVGALQVGVVHALVRHAVVALVALHIEDFVESFKQILVVL